MFTAWVLFPALLAGLALGAGLLVEALAGHRLPGVLLLPVGLAGLIVAGQATASFDPTAELTVPVAIVIALAGLALAMRRRRSFAPSWPAVAAFVVTGVIFGAPVIASGEPTLAGYIRLDDTATWLTLTDRIMEHGRSLDGLARSSYEATLAFNLDEGYPIGVFVPLGLGRAITGADVAWLIQPYMSVLAGALALSLMSLLGRLVARPWLRALAAAIASQAALLVGYVQWGGIKEIAAAMLVALAAALAVRFARSRPRRTFLGDVRAGIPLAVACAALLAVLSAGGAIWLLPPLAIALAIAVRRAGAREAARRALTLAALTILFSVPAIVTGAVLPPTSSPLTSETAQGNLFEPLELAQIAGVWPAGDFRADPVDLTSAYTLIAVAVAAACVGLGIAWWRRSRGPLLYVIGTLAAAALIVLLGSPWVDGKALATAAPAVLLAAALGAVALLGSGGFVRRALGWAAVIVLAAGVLWSNALAYRDVSLAPYDQLAELERIGEVIAGEGPTLMTEYQPYGVRHFLRESDPEGVSELRRRLTPLRNGDSVPKGVNADTDELSPSGLHVYRTLVLRRSPVQSRPPTPYELVWRGRDYEVWQRPAAGEGPEARLGLGNGLDPTSVLRCPALRRLVALEPGGAVTAAVRPGTVIAELDDARHPGDWAEGVRALRPGGDGTARTEIEIAHGGEWSAWLSGSVRGGVDLLIDGRPVGSARHFLNNYGFQVPLGETALEPGRHEVELRFSGADLHPGSGGNPEAAGPLILTESEPADAKLIHLTAPHAERLCGRRLDWVEID